MKTKEEKILLLGSLFHDIGKFRQRCESKNLGKHQQLGAELVDSLNEKFLKILDGDESALSRLKSVISGHHDKSTDTLIEICRESDHLSASERVEFAENEEPKDFWQHHFLCSLFSKIRLLNQEPLNLRYYKHSLLVKEDYKVLIPSYETKEDAVESGAHYKNQGSVFESFRKDLESILDIYNVDDDFDSLINLLLILFEKYMWCVPDFTGNPETDISLYNHLKDVAGISHALYLNNRESGENKKLALIIGDIPGIQNYIFDVVNKKPAKILRGRSIYIQILTRIFASVFLDKFGLTDVNLVMLAGGKFYILAPFQNDFSGKYDSAVQQIEKFLADNFFYDLKFAAGFTPFNYRELKSREITFGELIDRASYDLLKGRHKIFHNKFIKADNFKFVLDADYISQQEGISDSVKCQVTGKPIRKDRLRKIRLPEGEELTVDQQVKNEYEIGNKITKGAVLVSFDSGYNVLQVKGIEEGTGNNSDHRIIINPSLEELFGYKGDKRELLKNCYFIEVANYASLKDEKNVLDFQEMVKKNDGAEVLTLIKGDIDELGLLMSTGLFDKGEDDAKDYTAISRTTTLSNHLKYFFSFFVNGFLKEWDVSQRDSSKTEEAKKDQYVYTVFAGGDDLMLITTQSASLKLVDEFNKHFTDFVCENPEVHISYSLTNFKDSTPVRIISDISERNQKRVKNYYKNKKRDSFTSDKNKNGIYLFDTPLKFNSLKDLCEWKVKLAKWVKDEKNPVSKGTLYNLLFISNIIRDIEEKHNYSRILWHPQMVYYINRNLKNKEGKYKIPEIEDFFQAILSINTAKSLLIKRIVLPLVCEVIYKTRNK